MAATGPLAALDPAAIPPALVNRMLEREAWAQSCLSAHAGRSFAVAVGPLTSTMTVDASGRVGRAPGDAGPPDLRLELSPLAVPGFLANPLRWDELVTARGDLALAATLKGLAETLPWFVERVFAEALGPIVGQRVADVGRQLLAFPEYAAARLGQSLGRFARDEVGFAAHDAQARALADEIAEVAARTDALAARIDALKERLDQGNRRASPTDS